ncbi:MAG: alanine racemase [Lachnospiraceae bacterium]|nr:alanine racemase [Lachnospiraceae bacterium]
MNTYHRVWADIDLDAIRDNVINQRANIEKKGGSAKLCAVIKADGYGHGAVPIARAIDDLVWGYAVACVGEAVTLRENGIDKPILVLGYVDEAEFYDCIRYGIRISLYEKSIADALVQAVRRYRIETGNYTVKAIAHVKVDTGMGRIGFLTCTEEVFGQSVEEISGICKYPEIDFEGCFMHFSKCDEADKTFADLQYNRFKRMIEALADRGVEFRIRHCDNSAGIIDRPNWHMDMVRMGISLYGLYPSEEVDKLAVYLRPAMSIKSQIVFLKELPEGVPISYGGTFVTQRVTKVATVPVGYADGYPRLLSNKGFVLIRGKRARIIGRVCMDQFMVDVTDIEGVRKHDEVIIVGREGDEKISVEELGRLSGRFNYEFVCDISKRVPRIYHRDGKITYVKDYIHDKFDEQGN